MLVEWNLIMVGCGVLFLQEDRGRLGWRSDARTRDLDGCGGCVEDGVEL